MKNTGKIVIVVVVVIVIAGGAALLMHKKKDNNTPNSSNGSPSSSSTHAAATITYDGTSFQVSPSSVTAGSKVEVKNASQSDLQFDSDPHPVHTDEPELNAGEIGPGSSATFTVTKKGTWGFHNHLNPSQHGSITVN